MLKPANRSDSALAFVAESANPHTVKPSFHLRPFVFSSFGTPTSYGAGYEYYRKSYSTDISIGLLSVLPEDNSNLPKPGDAAAQGAQRFWYSAILLPLLQPPPNTQDLIREALYVLIRIIKIPRCLLVHTINVTAHAITSLFGPLLRNPPKPFVILEASIAGPPSLVVAQQLRISRLTSLFCSEALTRSHV